MLKRCCIDRGPVNDMRKSAQSGFSLVELMVSIVIGLLILAGVVQVVFTSKATFLAQEDMSYIQENARYALNVLGKDIRGAGYWGCSNTSPASTGVALDVDADAAASADAAKLITLEGITGYTADVLGQDHFPFNNYDRWVPEQSAGDHETESFIVRYAGGIPLTVTNDDSYRGIMQLEGDEPIEVNDFIAITASDCQSVGLFGATAAAGLDVGGVQQYLVGYSVGAVNCSTKIKPSPNDSHTCADGPVGGGTFFFPGAVAMKYRAHGYFIEESGVLPGQPALKRKVLAVDGGVVSIEEEIALGVEDMLILYGVQSENDDGVQLKSADELIADGDEWSSVTSVQVNLLFRSQSESLPQASNNVYLGNTYGNDRFLRQVVTSTFKLRNRI